MIQVAKLLLTDNKGRSLLLYRSNHPAFPNDPDLPGGTIEAGETPGRGLARELIEEIGLKLKPESLHKVHQSDGYDAGHAYYLYHAVWQGTPAVTLSWEHSRYEWLTKEELIVRTGTAIDHYMHMVHDYLTSTVR